MVNIDLVPLPFGTGWHFARLDQIVAVKYVGSKKTIIILMGGIDLEVSEDTHVVQKRIEDFAKFACRKDVTTEEKVQR